MGQISIYSPLKKDRYKKKNWKFHAHEVEENELYKERARLNEESSEEYVLISSLMGSVSHRSDTCLIDSVDSKHMIGYKDSLSCIIQEYSPHKVQFGDDY